MDYQWSALWVAKGRPKRKLRKKYSWNAVAAEREINGDDAQLELINCFQGNSLHGFHWNLWEFLLKSQGFSLHSFFLTFLPFPEWEESTWVDVYFGYTCTGDFKEWGVNYYSRSKESSLNMLESLPEVNTEKKFMQCVFTGAVNNFYNTSNKNKSGPL